MARSIGGAAADTVGLGDPMNQTLPDRDRSSRSDLDPILEETNVNRRTMRMMVLWCMVGLGGIAVFGCGERVDELGPYVEAYRAMDPYHEQLLQMEVALKADQVALAAGTSDVIKAYLAELTTIQLGKDKRLVAGHNKVKRTLEHALKKIVQPDFPTFPISALKQIKVIRGVVIVHINTLGKRWAEDERVAEFPLTWPGDE
jgi:hypothetical protein